MDARGVAEILGRAFAEDEPLLRALGLDAKRLAWAFFEPFLEMLVSGQPHLVFQEGKVGALVAMRSDWRPESWRAPLGFARNLLKRGGPRTLFGLMRLSWEFQRAAAPKEIRWRLLYVGVVPEARGKGIATKLIKQLFERAEGLPVQLEVEADNPAVRLYKKLGFEVEKEFKAAGVKWLAMVRPAIVSP